MNHPVRASVLAPLLLAVGATRPAPAEDEVPTRIVAIHRSGDHHARVGDLVTVTYTAQAVPTGEKAIRTLRSELQGESLKRVAVVIEPVAPARPRRPGEPYPLTIYFKAERAGVTKARVVPLMNDGTEGRGLSFSVDVGPGP